MMPSFAALTAVSTARALAVLAESSSAVVPTVSGGDLIRSFFRKPRRLRYFCSSSEERYSASHSRWRSRQSSSPSPSRRLSCGKSSTSGRFSLTRCARRFMSSRCSVNQSLTRRHVRLLRSHALYRPLSLHCDRRQRTGSYTIASGPRPCRRFDGAGRAGNLGMP